MSIVPREVSDASNIQLGNIFNHLNGIENMDNTIQNNIKYLYGTRNPDSMQKIGQSLYRTIYELRDVSTVMEHPEFYKFYYKYMRDVSKFKRMIILMKLYDIISHYLYKIDPNEVHHNSYHKLFILYNLLKNPEFVGLLLKRTNEVATDAVMSNRLN